MNLETLTVAVPRKENAIAAPREPISVWPLVDEALTFIEADDLTREAARAALTSSDGCAVLANYLNTEAGRAPNMDTSFKVPLIVLAAELALEDGGADVIYDPEEGVLFFETDEAQYAFLVALDWTVDWEAIADEVIPGYEWSGIEHQTWAFDQLLNYLDIGTQRTFGGE